MVTVTERYASQDLLLALGELTANQSGESNEPTLAGPKDLSHQLLL